jgi:hypothetical protein
MWDFGLVTVGLQLTVLLIFCGYGGFIFFGDEKYFQRWDQLGFCFIALNCI